jgi:hypothetical protein
MTAGRCDEAVAVWQVVAGRYLNISPGIENFARTQEAPSNPASGGVRQVTASKGLALLS